MKKLSFIFKLFTSFVRFDIMNKKKKGDVIVMVGIIAIAVFATVLAKIANE